MNNAQIKPEWLEIIACCCAKVQMDLIRAIVAWQTDGTMPDFRGTKKALFLMMVRDLSGQTAEESATAEASQEAETQQKEESQAPATEESPQQQPEPASKPAPATPARRKKDPRRNFFPYSPLY